MSKVVLITGGSSGIGKAVGNYLFFKGFIVYGTSRDSSKYPNSKFNLIDLDVNNKDSISSCVDKVINKEGKIDILVNNAGVGITGPLEEIPDNEILNNFSTNFNGPLMLIKKVLPYMRSNKCGLIINITSVLAYLGTPFRSIYSGSKSALDIVSETLNMEVKDHGINVVCIAPGDYSTNIAASRYHSRLTKDSPYYGSYSKALENMNSDVNKGSDPVKIGKLVYKIINKKKPKIKYTTGTFIEKSVPFLKFILPQRLFQYIVIKSFN